MSQTILPFRSLTAPPARGAWRSLVARVRARLAEARTRRQLMELDGRGLSDIGMSPAQAQFLSERPVWELVPFLHR